MSTTLTTVPTAKSIEAAQVAIGQAIESGMLKDVTDTPFDPYTRAKHTFPNQFLACQLEPAELTESEKSVDQLVYEARLAIPMPLRVGLRPGFRHYEAYPWEIKPFGEKIYDWLFALECKVLHRLGKIHTV